MRTVHTRHRGPSAAGGRVQRGATRQSVALATAARDLGYDAIMLAAPPTSLPSAARAGRPLRRRRRGRRHAGRSSTTTRHVPASRSGYECLDAVADIPTSSPSRSPAGTSRACSVLHRTTRASSTSCAASDDQAADYFAWGVRSWLAGTANVLPRQHVVIMNTANEGDYGLARRQFAAILPWIQNMESGSYNSKAKLGLRHQGFDCGPVRAPLLGPSATSPPSSRRARPGARRPVRQELMRALRRGRTPPSRSTPRASRAPATSARCSTCPARDARQAAPHQRGRRHRSASSLLRAPRPAADQRQPGVPSVRPAGRCRVHHLPGGPCPRHERFQHHLRRDGVAGDRHHADGRADDTWYAGDGGRAHPRSRRRAVTVVASGSRSTVCRRSSRRSTCRCTCPASGDITVDVAYGGCYYVFADPAQFGVKLNRESAREVVEPAELVMAAASERHGAAPGDPRDRLHLVRDADRRRRSRGWRSGARRCSAAGSIGRRAGPAPRPGWPAWRPAVWPASAAGSSPRH